MSRQRHYTLHRQFLLIGWTVLALAAPTMADDKFPNELNTNDVEPRISLQDRSSTRTVSSRTIVTDDPVIRLAFEARESARVRMLSTDRHRPWQIMHALLALRQDLDINHNGRTVSALDWIAEGQSFSTASEGRRMPNEPWFETTRFGARAHPYTQPWDFEGHVNQFLAILSMCSLPLDYEFGADNGRSRITMRDMLRNAQMTVRTESATEEITWTLWALSRYLPPDARWTNSKGEQWSIERLVRIQTEQSLQGSPCGGTHGLFALAHARNVYLRTGQPLRGDWMAAEYKIRKYIQTARMQQNPDGSLSSNFFRGKEYNPDMEKRLASSGHILEFLMMAVPQEELSESWIRRAVEANARDVLASKSGFVSASPLYHSVDALTIYLERVAPAQKPEAVAEKSDATRPISTPQQGRVPVRTADAGQTASPPQGDVAANANDTGSDNKASDALPPASPMPMNSSEVAPLKPVPVEPAPPADTTTSGAESETPVDPNIEAPHMGGEDSGEQSPPSAPRPPLSSERPVQTPLLFINGTDDDAAATMSIRVSFEPDASDAVMIPGHKAIGRPWHSPAVVPDQSGTGLPAADAPHPDRAAPVESPDPGGNDDPQREWKATPHDRRRPVIRRQVSV